MNLRVFRSFVKTAVALQIDASDSTPPGYKEVRAAVANRYPDLEREEPRPNKIINDPERVKLSSTGRHLMELGGLATLAAPSVQELRHKPMSEKRKAGLEVAGLGTLAAPYVHDLAMKNPHYAGAAGKVLSRFHR
jgi:hypothetical protein